MKVTTCSSNKNKTKQKTTAIEVAAASNNQTK